MEKLFTRFILAASRACGTTFGFEGIAPVYTDEHIERCAKLYMQNPELRARGVLFVMFLAQPQAYLRAIDFGLVMPLPPGEEFYPLLPDQRAVRDRIDCALAVAVDVEAHVAKADAYVLRRRMRVSNGAGVEPLHHRTWPRHEVKRVAKEVGA